MIRKTKQTNKHDQSNTIITLLLRHNFLKNLFLGNWNSLYQAHFSCVLECEIWTVQKPEKESAQNNGAEDEISSIQGIIWSKKFEIFSTLRSVHQTQGQGRRF